jgi:hypothetical protein
VLCEYRKRKAKIKMPNVFCDDYNIWHVRHAHLGGVVLRFHPVGEIVII